MPGTYYLFWLIVPTLFAIALAHPSILVVVVIAFVARRWIPDPISYVRHAGRVRSLQQQVDINPANAVARAQLGEIWLAKRRPRRAIPMFEHALERDRGSAELHYLLGLARLRSGDAEGALAPLSEALAKEPKVRYGSAYLAIGEALAKLGRLDEAIDAFERFIKINTSSLEGCARLAAARSKKGDEPGAADARKQAFDTYRVLPPFQRRKQVGWWLRLKLLG
jgi:tetratricopeptide (TPR) repeat protein